jgi:hypothetical protein
MMNHMRVFAGLLSLMCAAVLLCGGCGKSAPTGANGNGGTNAAAASPGMANGNTSSNAGGAQELDTSKLDAEIAGLEQQAEKNPDDEEANLRVAQITQEIGAEPHAEDGKPVAVPAKPGANENN